MFAFFSPQHYTFRSAAAPSHGPPFLLSPPLATICTLIKTLSTWPNKKKKQRTVKAKRAAMRSLRNFPMKASVKLCRYSLLYRTILWQNTYILHISIHSVSCPLALACDFVCSVGICDSLPGCYCKIEIENKQTVYLQCKMLERTVCKLYQILPDPNKFNSHII